MFHKEDFASTDVDIVEAKYLTTQSRLRRARIALAGVVLICTLSIIGTAGHSLKEFNDTIIFNEWILPVWPTDVDSRGTKALVGTGVIIVVGSIAVLAMGLLPSPYPKTNLQNALAVATGAVGLVASLFGVSFAFALNARQAETIMTWSCKWEDVYEASKPNFKHLCVGSRYSLYLMIPLMVFELFMFVLGVLGFLTERQIASQREEPIDRKNSQDVDAVA